MHAARVSILDTRGVRVRPFAPAVDMAPPCPSHRFLPALTTLLWLHHLGKLRAPTMVGNTVDCAHLQCTEHVLLHVISQNLYYTIITTKRSTANTLLLQ